MAVLRRALLWTFVGLLLSGSVAAQQEVGHLVEIVPAVWGTPQGGAKGDLAVNDPILLNMRVETGNGARAAMTFYPEGALELGQNVRLVIDRSRVDSATGRQESGLKVLLGRLLAFFSPSVDRDVEIETPSARMGIRGTVVGVDVAASGSTVVAVLEGVVEVSALAGGSPLRLTAGFYTVVDPGGQPTPPAPIEPGSWTLSAAADAEPFQLPQERFPTDSPLPREGQFRDPQAPFDPSGNPIP